MQVLRREGGRRDSHKERCVAIRVYRTMGIDDDEDCGFWVLPTGATFSDGNTAFYEYSFRGEMLEEYTKVPNAWKCDLAKQEAGQ